MIRNTIFKIMPLLIITAACNNQKNNYADDENESSRAVQDTEDTTIVMINELQQFASEAASDGMMEVKMADIAIRRSQDQSVKDLARTIKNDHQKANQELKQIAQNSHLTFSDTLLSKHQQKVDTLADVVDEKFDMKYVQMMIAGHQEAIAKFEATSNKGRLKTDQQDERNPDSNQRIEGWINEYLPVLKMHLNSSKEVRAKLK